MTWSIGAVGFHCGDNFLRHGAVNVGGRLLAFLVIALVLSFGCRLFADDIH